MSTDWQVKPLSRKSSLSGESFTPGTNVVCYIYSDPNLPNEILRTDILAEESGNFELPKNLLARWTRIVRDREDDEQKEAQKQTLTNAEEFFLSLYDELNENTRSLSEPSETTTTRNILKQLLGLMLERKRILRRLKNKDKNLIYYLHVPTKKEYQVPQITLNLEEIAKIQAQLNVLII